MLEKEKVYKLVGQPFEQYRDGFAWGCLAPMYEMIPETQAYKYDVYEWGNMLDYFRKECTEVPLKDIQYGDIVIVKPPILPFHLLMYLGNGKVLHCNKATAMEIIPLSKYEDRVKGVFRYGNCGNNLGDSISSINSN